MTPTSGAADLLAMVSKALREAYNLGQRYWQQADSEYISQHKKADDTRAKFLTLVEETCAALSADSVPAVSDLPPLPAPDLRDVGTKPQEIKEFLKGYATEYARTAIAARAPAGVEESRTIPDREIPGIVEKALQELEGLVKYATSTYGHWNMRRAKGALSDLEWWARRKLAAHAQAADSVQEDAALWHWLAEYLVGTRTDLDDEIVASETVNDLRKLVESAIKQGEKQ